VKDRTGDLEKLYRSWSSELSGGEATIEDIRAMFEHWGDVTAEPLDTDYTLTRVAGRMDGMWVRPKGADPRRTLLCFHGGGYVLGSMYTHRKLFGHYAQRAGCSALILEYRRAPEHPHPAQVDDAVAAYGWLMNEERLRPGEIAFVGDSAGGALAITGMLRAREQGLPMPATAVVAAPYLDTEAKGQSYDTNADRDGLGARAATLQFMQLFLGKGGDPHDPLANPLFADLANLPPVLVQVGGHDVLLDDSVRFHERARAAGIECELEIFPDMQHVFQFLAGNSAVADKAIDQAGRWLSKCLSAGKASA
jgi:monoterpene epsilon-lactone hydrolase